MIKIVTIFDKTVKLLSATMQTSNVALNSGSSKHGNACLA